MTRLIRRHSMERLELYDLDKLTPNSSRSYRIPPSLPPPRKYRRRPSVNTTLERYEFLCNKTRSKIDPIYAATPMFTTIPQSSKKLSPRQILGSYIRLENVKPLSAGSKNAEVDEEMKGEQENVTPLSTELESAGENEKIEEEQENVKPFSEKSPEPKSDDIDEEIEEEQENDDDDENEDDNENDDDDDDDNEKEDDNDNDDNNNQSNSSSSSGSDEEQNNDDDDDKDDNKGVVEQIFDRHKKN